MEGSLSVSRFDRESIDDKGLRSRLDVWEQEIRRHARKTAQHLLDIARVVHAAHEELAGAGRNGLFKPWVESVGLERTKAYDLVRVIELQKRKCGNFHTLSDEEVGLIDQSALALLAKETTPEPDPSEKSDQEKLKDFLEGELGGQPKNGK